MIVPGDPSVTTDISGLSFPSAVATLGGLIYVANGGSATVAQLGSLVPGGAGGKGGTGGAGIRVTGDGDVARAGADYGR